MSAEITFSQLGKEKVDWDEESLVGLKGKCLIAQQQLQKKTGIHFQALLN
jgi:hypothetical protein